eukprot:GHVU01018813.1.p2 GENE.GHVU01018813.1~~GHVU01018813.1.p2  ORF type:complete len:108 (-),score=1.35 GHVU01018813.1:328-651(-)
MKLRCDGFLCVNVVDAVSQVDSLMQGAPYWIPYPYSTTPHGRGGRSSATGSLDRDGSRPAAAPRRTLFHCHTFPRPIRAGCHSATAQRSTRIQYSLEGTAGGRRVSV